MLLRADEPPATLEILLFHHLQKLQMLRELQMLRLVGEICKDEAL